ncbi:F0F1 ATP synthase subunit B [Amylibacter sp.]|nr:F0F1 ATP synthase subunit B [Amylibacter sp.]MDB4221088.1 F0F1 ATP synthase subunit B [Amylibacter sp.]MDB9729728.1 F0F1 ATP synthase subunit B [Amylibacter sp.]MDB9763451.1 F0F1 ATP synthase subunit B [Amylibacter sp.]MDC1253038.1 F0F1 ATP synthase subunit B [Amylibacter sp.]
MRIILSLIIALLGNPVFAASGPFISLSNTNFVVLLAFLLFVGVIVYLKVPGKLNGMLDERAKGIKSELDEARSLREDAQSILADYERKQKEVQKQADQIVANAKEEAKAAALVAKDNLNASIKRRLAAAEEQIVSAQIAAIKEVKDTAVTVAIAAAKDVISIGMNTSHANDLIESAIKDVNGKFH